MTKKFPLYYTNFLQICLKNAETKQAKKFGHLSHKERRTIAERFCKRVWNQNKKEIIPQMHTIMYRAPMHQKQQKMDVFISKKEQMSVETLVEQYIDKPYLYDDLE